MDSPPFSPSSSEEEEGDSFTSEIFSVTSDGSLIARFLRTDLLEILCRVNVGAFWADFFVAECIARALFEANNASDADDDARGEVAIISLKLSVFFVYTKVLSLSLALGERAKDELYEFKLEQSGGMQMRTISLFYTFAK